MNQLQRLGLVTGALLVLGIQPVGAEGKGVEEGSEAVKGASSEVVKDLHPITASLHPPIHPSTYPPIHPITYIRDLNRSTTTVKEWLAQMDAAIVQVTRVQLNRSQCWQLSERMNNFSLRLRFAPRSGDSTKMRRIFIYTGQLAI